LRDKLLDDFEFFGQLSAVSAVVQNQPLFGSKNSP
jgi:hypothetical protein